MRCVGARSIDLIHDVMIDDLLYAGFACASFALIKVGYPLCRRMLILAVALHRCLANVKQQAVLHFIHSSSNTMKWYTLAWPRRSISDSVTNEKYAEAGKVNRLPT